MSNELTTEVQPLQIQVVAAFSKNEVAISDVTKYMELTVEKNGIGKVTAGRVAVKKLRVAIDHRRKELIETALETQRTVNAHAKALTALVTPVEDYLQSQEDAHEAAKLKAEQERQSARRAILTGRIERLAQAGAVATDVAALESMTPEEFERHLLSESARVAAEREQREAARIAAEKLEADRLAEVERVAAEQQAELFRQQEANRIEAARLEEIKKQIQSDRLAEEKRQEESNRIERSRIDAERAELKRQADELRAKQEADRLRVEAENAERQRVRDEESRMADEVDRAMQVLDDDDEPNTETGRRIDLAAAKTTPDGAVVMRFIDAPMGCRFRYHCSEQIWIKLSIYDIGIIAAYDPRWMQTPNWHGQQICSFAESEDEMRTLSIEVLG